MNDSTEHLRRMAERHARQDTQCEALAERLGVSVEQLDALLSAGPAHPGASWVIEPTADGGAP